MLRFISAKIVCQSDKPISIRHAPGCDHKPQLVAVTRSFAVKSTLLAVSSLLISPNWVAANPVSSVVTLKTLSDCKLAVAVYPTFDYNASGGGGVGTVRECEDGRLFVSFDATNLVIPPINTSSTKVLGVSLPPPLQIEIVPQILQGMIDPQTGVAELEFLAQFKFRAGSLYTAPPLSIKTVLTTEHADGKLRHGRGKRLRDNKLVLTGVARVPRTGDDFLDKFLTLPTDALAVLSAELILS